VAGADEAKAELQEIVEFLRHPASITIWERASRAGVLLVGPPGTGKTLMARAIAGEAGVAFFNLSASEFVEMFVGVAPAACAICSSKPKPPRPPSSLLTSSMRSVAAVAQDWAR